VPRGRTVRRLFYAFAGVALGGLGVGWHGRPTDAAIGFAIRARDPAHLRDATIAIVDVDRNWMHEIWGTQDSHFLVSVTITRPGEPPEERCYQITPQIGAAFASGPWEMWRCDHPF
jgi:hypothetical protein